MKNIPVKKRNACFHVEHAIIRRKDNCLEVVSKEIFTIPIEQINVLILGAGTSITYAAVSLASQHKVIIQWCKEEHRMFAYAEPNRNCKLLLKQCELFINDRIRIAKLMFKKRFNENVETISIEKLRGLEGVRVREAYNKTANKYNVEWKGRNYIPGKFDESDLPNRMITFVNQLMYGLSCSIIVQLGLSPAVGFIHTGTSNSFVYDISDLYKIEVNMEVAFEAASSLFNQKHFALQLFNERIQKLDLSNRMVNDIMELLK